jgi:hypothetical protein
MPHHRGSTSLLLSPSEAHPRRLRSHVRLDHDLHQPATLEPTTPVLRLLALRLLVLRLLVLRLLVLRLLVLRLLALRLLVLRLLALRLLVLRLP